MKVHLLFRDREFAWRAVLDAADAHNGSRPGQTAHGSRSAGPPRPWNASDLVRDLRLGILCDAMANGDALVRETALTALLGAPGNDLETVRHRQAVLRDALANPETIRELYLLAGEARAKASEPYVGSLLTRYPDWSLRNSLAVIEALLASMTRLRRLAESGSSHFEAEGWRSLFASIRNELDARRIGQIREHLQTLRFRDGLLLSARLGEGNRGEDYRLHHAPPKPGGWLVRFLREHFPQHFYRSPWGHFDFQVHPRDESGARALAEVGNRGIAIAASSLGEATDNVRDFFAMLQCELAFYVGCLNLHDQLRDRDVSLCFPTIPEATDPHRFRARDLREVCLVLTETGNVVGNDINADRRNLIVVTGANQGGKSTFLRSMGLAQIMLQAGMYVTAESLEASLCDGLFTHFAREEDARLESGKLDEELCRFSRIADHVTAESLILCNESFASTNEREGSEIAHQIAVALRERNIRMVIVTHLYEFAHRLYQEASNRILFLRAEREQDGNRTYRLAEGGPLETGFAEDLYNRIFNDQSTSQSGAAR